MMSETFIVRECKARRDHLLQPSLIALDRQYIIRLALDQLLSYRFLTVQGVNCYNTVRWNTVGLFESQLHPVRLTTRKGRH